MLTLTITKVKPHLESMLDFASKTLFFLYGCAFLSLLGCGQSTERAEKAADMVALLQGFPSEWVRVQPQENGEFVIVEPYAEINTTFVFRMMPGQGYMLQITRGLNQEHWRIVAVERTGEQYRFFLQHPILSQTTVLQYQDNPTAIGQWTETEPIIAFKTPFFVPADQTGKFEKTFAPPPDPASDDQAARTRRYGIWGRWRGGMDGDRDLTAFFCLKEDYQSSQFLKGNYYYEHIWKDLTLRPHRVDSSKTWDLREFIGRERNKWTGAFVGTMDEQFRFEGSWTAPEGKDPLKFWLTEEVLPFVLEDYQRWHKTPTQRLDTLYYPVLAALPSDTVLGRFNDSIIPRRIRRWRDLSQSSLTPVRGDYALLYANDRLMSLSFSIYREAHKPEVHSLNFDLQTGATIQLSDLYPTDDPKFAQRLVILAQQLLRLQNPAPKKLPEALGELEQINCLFENLRLLYFDPVSYYYYTLYIPYEKLKPFEREQFTQRYGLLP